MHFFPVFPRCTGCLPAIRFGLATLAAAGLVAAAAAQDLRQSPHNLGRSTSIPAGDAGRVCVFCHTPTAPATPGSGGVVPRWQHGVPSSHVFPTYDDIGRLGLEGSSAVGSQSVACLSCHDSNQAMSVSRLSFDHPFGIPYRGALTPAQREQARDQARRSGAPLREAQQLKFEEDFRPAYRGIVDNRPVWWLSRQGNADRRGRYDLPLYVRRDELSDSEVPFVECASCHDPHSVNPQFLRTIPGDGGLCLNCHVK
jgi:predicted CXXCH cytochrome family protein